MWTKERIEKLTPGEIKNLRKNALERGADDVAALCDEVSGTKLKRAAVKSTGAKAPPKSPRKVPKKPAAKV